MNFIQRAWLIVLRPVSSFVNQKMATKSGLVGKLGRFIAIGPRQFGYHPSNRLFAWLNQFILAGMGNALHRRAFLRDLSGKGYTAMRTSAFQVFIGPIIVFYSFMYMVLPQGYQQEDGTTLQNLKRRIRLAPMNALEDRKSAHYSQINGYYQIAMSKKFNELEEEIVSQRKYLDEKTKKTKYAVPSYTYIQPHTNPDGL